MHLIFIHFYFHVALFFIIFLLFFTFTYLSFIRLYFFSFFFLINTSILLLHIFIYSPLISIVF